MSTKIGLVWGSAVVLLFGMMAVLNSHAADTPTNQRMENANRAGEHAFKASELIGLGVKTADNEEKGKIKDLMIAPDGRVEYAAVSFGGFAGIGSKLFAVPLDAIHLEWKNNKLDLARVDVTEQTIKQHQGFDENNWPQQADRGFIASQPGRVQR